MYDNKGAVLEAVKQDGRALQLVSEDLRNDKEVVLAAVKQYGGALKYASENLKNDKEVVLEAVKKSGEALAYASPALRGGGLTAYVQRLLSTYTVRPDVFLGTFLCGMGPRSPPVSSHAENQGNDAVITSQLRTEASHACILEILVDGTGELNGLGEEGGSAFIKNIAAYAGVQCRELCCVRAVHFKILYLFCRAGI